VRYDPPEDDSCSKCGQLSPDGMPHFRCPCVCSECDYAGDFHSVRGCPNCSAWEIYQDLNDEEKMAMKGYLDDEA